MGGCSLTEHAKMEQAGSLRWCRRCQQQFYCQSRLPVAATHLVGSYFLAAAAAPKNADSLRIPEASFFILSTLAACRVAAAFCRAASLGSRRTRFSCGCSGSGRRGRMEAVEGRKDHMEGGGMAGVCCLSIISDLS